MINRCQNKGKTYHDGDLEKDGSNVKYKKGVYTTKRYIIKYKNDTYVVKEEFKQDLAGQACRIKRYEENVRFFQLNS